MSLMVIGSTQLLFPFVLVTKEPELFVRSVTSHYLPIVTENNTKLKIGEDVRNFKVGDRVGVPWLYSACGACEFCITGWETLCAQQKNCGFSVDGCLRQVTVAPADHAVPIPDGLELEQAARKENFSQFT